MKRKKLLSKILIVLGVLLLAAGLVFRFRHSKANPSDTKEKSSCSTEK